MAATVGTLLIAEPGCKLVSVLKPWLLHQGFEVKAVEDMKGLLMTLQCENVRALVLDVCLAESMDYEAISIIKGLCRNLPIIVTTESNNPEQESSVRQKGIFYYHVKSFGLDELVLAIANAMMRPH